MDISIIQILIFIIRCLESVHSGYYFGSSETNWDDAKTKCETRGMQLVSLKNESQYLAAKAYLETKGLNQGVWIGLITLSTEDPFVYRWMDGEEAVYFKWGWGEPNYQNTSQCIRLFQYNLEFGTLECAKKRHFLCEDPDIQGGWSSWSTWSVCNATCGNGTQIRTRSCDSPRPSTGGAYCTGEEYEEISCNLGFCPVDGSWSQWGDWSICTLSLCSATNRTRSRSCDSPSPKYGGRNCEGEGRESESCENEICPTGEHLMCTEFLDNEITSSALEEKLTEISNLLKVNKTSLSSQKRKRACAEDPRSTSMYIGYVGVIFISCFFGIIIFVDCSSLIVWAWKKYT